jgi:hypothetical protein
MLSSNRNPNLISHHRKLHVSSGARLPAMRVVSRWTVGAAIMAVVLMASCSTPVTILAVSGPSTATPGVPFTVTVTALANGNQDKIFNMDVHFSSSDSAAILPIDYTFTAADAGSHMFTNGITLMTVGTQTITATATFAHSITGTAIVTVQTVPDNRR